MIEYLYDAIRATAGIDANITAEITEESGKPIEEGCSLMLSDDDAVIAMIEGSFNGDVWEFNIPAATTEGLSGRFWYCIHHNENTLCFKEPIYFV